MLTQYFPNPTDIDGSYDKIRLYRATAKGGIYALISTTTVDTTTAVDGYYGYTKVDDSGGDSNKWYKYTYYNSVTLAESGYSEEMPGGITEFDLRVRRRMKDSDYNKYFFSNDEVIDARDAAIKSLYPATWIDTAYDVLIVDGSNDKTITLPSYIARPDKIKVYNSDGDYCGEYLAFYRVGNKIYALTDFPDGYTFRFIITKPYRLLHECPEEYYTYLIDAAEIELLKLLEMDRARYYKYTAVVRPEGGNMPSLSKIIERLEVTTRKKRDEIRRVRETGEISLV